METYDFSRPVHYTASVFVIHDNKVLLLKQDRSPFWLLPGGHIEDTELPHEAAIREVFEETGLKVELLQIPDENSKTKLVTPLPLPYDIRLLPCRDKRDIDFIFTAKVIGGKLKINHESEQVKWFTKEDLESDQKLGPYTKYHAIKLLKGKLENATK